MDIIKHILNFITDSSKRWTTRALISIGIILVVLGVNDYTGFTYHWKLQNKLRTLKLVNELLSDTTLTQAERSELEVRKYEVLHRTNVFQELSSLFFSWRFNASPNKSANSQIEKQTNNPKESDANKSDIRNPVLMFVSSSFAFIVLFILLIYVFLSQLKTPSLYTFAASAIMGFLIIGFAALFTNLFWKIPLMFSSPWVNYTLNFILHMTFIAGFIFFLSRMKK